MMDSCFTVFIIGLLLFAVFFMPVLIYGILNSGNIAGMLFSALLLGYGVRFKSINLLLKSLFNGTYSKIIIYLSVLVVTFLSICVCVVSIKMYRVAHQNDYTDTTVVVLGCRVKENGPGVMLNERIKSAYNFLTEYPEAKCILSGGKGIDEPISEAECMYNELIEMGISSERLFLESNSTSTKENIKYSIDLIKQNSLVNNVTVLTNEFHAYRAAKIFRSYGIKCSLFCARTNIILFPTYYIRELLCIFKEILF